MTEDQPQKGPPWWASWPLLLVAALILLVSGIRIAQTGELDAEESLAMGAGLLLLGMWAATEIWRFRG